SSPDRELPPPMKPSLLVRDRASLRALFTHASEHPALSFPEIASMNFLRTLARPLLALPLVLALSPSARVLAGPPPPPPGHLLASRSLYAGVASTVVVGSPLPGGGFAVHDGTYPGVWDNEAPDASFGVTSPIYLDRYAVAGTTLTPVRTVPVPTDR